MGMNKYATSTSLFIGESMDGGPVFWDAHSCVFNNKPPVTVITGQPGSGKTFLGSLLVMNSAIVGKQTVVLDPKGDFLPLAGMKDEVGDVVVWNLNDNTKAGILDPFNIVKNPGEKLSLATSVIDLFLGGLEPDETTILQPLIKDVIETKNPSLQKVVMELKKTQGDSIESAKARQLGSRLDSISVMPYSKLCFSPGGNKKLGALSDNLTIITLLGLPLPKSDSDQLQVEGKLASGIIYLITYLIGKMMTEENLGKLPRTLFIDEAWQILSNPYGATLIEEYANLGRSLNMAMILATQNNTHLKNLNIENTVSTRFAFATDQKEAKKIVNDMNLSEDDNFEEVFTNLGTGQCVMQDWEKRYAAITVSMWKPEWITMLASNPKDRMRKAAEEKAARNKAV